MLDLFHQGGWGMYPTTIVGILLAAAAVHYARRPDRRRLALTRGLAALTLIASTLGFVTGVIATFTCAAQIPASELAGTVLVGVAESLTNIVLGLVLVFVAGVVTVIGRARAGTADAGAELADPHVT